MNENFIRGIGILFDVPLGQEELFNRHVRLSGSDGAVFGEGVQGVTGLRVDPSIDVRRAQVAGKPTPPLHDWDSFLSSRLHRIPTWNDFSLSQLSPDGYTFRKRTK